MVRTCVSFLRAHLRARSQRALIGTQTSKIGSLTEMTSHISPVLAAGSLVSNSYKLCPELERPRDQRFCARRAPLVWFLLFISGSNTLAVTLDGAFGVRVRQMGRCHGRGVMPEGEVNFPGRQRGLGKQVFVRVQHALSQMKL
ncbi:hypothetical protein BU25DRAFT_155419 [Macroventuria anomochaeta]|uniref:Uncharacterized protein n=1 Tax=Macroventuria anomochaeta TaxID=301207 RepID=A0ACB6RUI4_9PLEO|nr:uncharacterized protein BU25DRAFT_155419 [Macroventuria anomochaeta]KAF2624562.1 hypothetical protein BU25DRAFT_155419 [Macroventuria anomochaeta]